jgi:flagellar biosynthesis protein FlhG
MLPEYRKQKQAGHSIQTIAVTGGKGGIGKSTVAVNMATALAQAGERVLLLDGDLGLASTDVLLGLTPRFTLQHVLDGERTLEEILLRTRDGVHVVPAASGVTRMVQLGAAEHAAIIHAFATLPQQFDVLIVDTAPGIGDQVRRFSEAAQSQLVVLCDEPSALTDAYALIKVLSREHGLQRFHVLVNKVRDGSGELLFRRLQRVTDRYLDVALLYAGEIPDDRLLHKSIKAQRAVVEAYPGSPSARALRQVAKDCRKWPRQAIAGGLEFFFENLFTEPPKLRIVK